MNAVLEVAIGLGFVFLLFSSITSAIVEWISAVKDRRAKTLRAALTTALGATLTDALLGHPAIAGIPPSKGKRPAPTYLSPKTVALVLADLTAPPGVGPDTTDDPASARLAQLLATFTREADGSSALLFRLEKWFIEQMEHTSGLYKRWTQIGTFLVAIIITGSFDLDAGRIAIELNRNAVLRTAVADRVGHDLAGKTLDQLDSSVRSLSGFPIGWTRSPVELLAPGAALKALAGWLITTIALSLGAPFWFDVLNRIINLRQTGARPSEQMVAQ